MNSLFEPRVSGTESPVDWMPADKLAELSGIKLRNELNSPSLRSASIQPTRPDCHLVFAPGSGDIHVRGCWLRCSGTGKQFFNRKETICLPLLNAWFEPRVSGTETPANWVPTDEPTEPSRIKLKKLNSPPLWSASIQPTQPYHQLAFAPGSGDIYVCCC